MLSSSLFLTVVWIVFITGGRTGSCVAQEVLLLLRTDFMLILVIFFTFQLRKHPYATKDYNALALGIMISMEGFRADKREH